VQRVLADAAFAGWVWPDNPELEILHAGCIPRNPERKSDES
jgi:hypothetical protein